MSLVSATRPGPAALVHVLVVLLSVALFGKAATAGFADTSDNEKRQSLTRLAREWSYVEARARHALDMPSIASEKLAQMLEGAQSRRESCESAAEGDLGALREPPVEKREIARASADLNAALWPDVALLARLADPYVRLDPEEAMPHGMVERMELLALPGEHCDAGLVLANCTHKPLRCRIAIESLPTDVCRVHLRRQVFLEDFYRREKARIADPLPLVPEGEGGWDVLLDVGETAKFQIEIAALPSASGPVETVVEVTTNGGDPIRLPLTLRVVDAPAPDASAFDYCAFLYLKSFAASAPERTAQDLADHGVTMMEFAHKLPAATFTLDGEIASIDFTEHDRFLRAYAPHIRRIMIYWPSYPYARFRIAEDSPLIDDTMVGEGTDVWDAAFTNLLRAWSDHVREMGFGPERFVNYVMDEPAGDKTERAVHLFELGRKVLPDFDIPLMLTDYVSPAELDAMLPRVQIVFPCLPFREALPPHKAKSWRKRFPADYNPRETWEHVFLPKLLADRAARGTECLSYHITRGKVDAVLPWYRAYPLVAANMGLTGAGHWAYLDPQGSTWNPYDGSRGRPDYVLVYDGAEDAAASANPAKELIVPSIRWQALRAGLQDARLLRVLIDRADRLSSDDAAALRALRERVGEWSCDEDTPTPESVADVSRGLRVLYARLAPPATQGDVAR